MRVPSQDGKVSTPEDSPMTPISMIPVEPVRFAIEKAQALRTEPYACKDYPMIRSLLLSSIQLETLSENSTLQLQAAGHPLVFFGLMCDSCTLFIRRGERIEDATIRCLIDSWDAIQIMILSAQMPALSSPGLEGLQQLITKGFESLSLEFEYASFILEVREGDEEVFQRKVEIQKIYVDRTLRALQGLRSSPIAWRAF